MTQKFNLESATKEHPTIHAPNQNQNQYVRGRQGETQLYFIICIKKIIYKNPDKNVPIKIQYISICIKVVTYHKIIL